MCCDRLICSNLAGPFPSLPKEVEVHHLNHVSGCLIGAIHHCLSVTRVTAPAETRRERPVLAGGPERFRSSFHGQITDG